ncbi:MAG: hypothetical protein WBP41_12735 [Saprospiraceae bacterium]
MKSLLHFVFFFALNTIICTTSNSQTINQVLAPKTYIVELKTEAFDGAGNKPTHRHIISFFGSPGTGSTVNRIDLNFTIDNRYEINKPIFDKATKIASAWFPMSEFEKYLDICRTKMNGLQATFHYSDLLKSASINFIYNGKLP